MKIYSADYHMRHGYGAYTEYRYVVAASTESEALGLVLMAEVDTVARGWSFEEIDLVSAPVAIQISEDSR